MKKPIDFFNKYRSRKVRKEKYPSGHVISIGVLTDRAGSAKNRKERQNPFAVLCEFLCALCVNLHFGVLRKRYPASLICISLILCMMLTQRQVAAQSCGNSGPSACTPANLTNPGFEGSSYPCVIKTVGYNQTLSFKMYSTINFAGSQVIDSVQFTGVTNFPCGLCWSTNHSNNLFYPNDSGCLNLSGKTTDSVGQYPIELTLLAWVNGNTAPQLVPATLVTDAGIRLWIPVIAEPGACPPIDTTTNSSKNVFASCTSGIEEINSNISSVNIAPNPISTKATLSFYAASAFNYQLRITDLMGRIIWSRELQVIPGQNTSVIERNNLPAGIYFLSLTDQNSVITRKFVVTD
jgi:hypothetical protein